MTLDFIEHGFTTFPFPIELRKEMIGFIDNYIRKIGKIKKGPLEQVAQSISDDDWLHKMSRCFRIFPPSLAKKIFRWSQHSLHSYFDYQLSAVNVVLPQEVEENPNLTSNDLAIYWRCVRPGKPDAGRPHKDASFWELEIDEGYDPKIPFEFNYLDACKKIWIPLDGCCPQTTLRVIPGSHRIKLPTKVEQTSWGRRPSICPQWLKNQESTFISPPELSKGSCIAMDMNLVHQGPQHNRQKLRISAEFNFITK